MRSLLEAQKKGASVFDGVSKSLIYSPYLTKKARFSSWALMLAPAGGCSERSEVKDTVG